MIEPPTPSWEDKLSALLTLALGLVLGGAAVWLITQTTSHVATTWRSGRALLVATVWSSLATGGFGLAAAFACALSALRAWPRAPSSAAAATRSPALRRRLGEGLLAAGALIVLSCGACSVIVLKDAPYVFPFTAVVGGVPGLFGYLIWRAGLKARRGTAAAEDLAKIFK